MTNINFIITHCANQGYFDKIKGVFQFSNEQKEKIYSKGEYISLTISQLANLVFVARSGYNLFYVNTDATGNLFSRMKYEISKQIAHPIDETKRHMFYNLTDPILLACLATNLLFSGSQIFFRKKRIEQSQINANNNQLLFNINYHQLLFNINHINQQPAIQNLINYEPETDNSSKSSHSANNSEQQDLYQLEEDFDKLLSDVEDNLAQQINNQQINNQQINNQQINQQINNQQINQ